MLKNTFLRSYLRILSLIILACLMTLCFSGCVMDYFKKDDDATENESNAEPSEIIWFPATPYYAMDYCMTPVLWNSTKVSSVLKSELTKAKSTDRFALRINVNTNISDSYVYNGVTYEDYRSNKLELENLYYKLRNFSKKGQYLKYGKDIYLTGAPDGEIWTEEYYNYHIEYYGSELLDKYIVNSVFLEEKLLEDMSEAFNEFKRIEKLLPEIEITCRETITSDIAKILQDLGFECTTQYKTIYLIITKEDLAALKFDEKHRCTFLLDTHPDDIPTDSDD